METYKDDFLKSNDYEFLRQNDNLGENVIYLTLSGSIGYGTNIDGSDIDLRGVAFEKKECLFGFEEFEQYEDKSTDTVIYGLKKFVSLALKGNPNILELLGTKDEHVVYISKFGKMLRNNSKLFLSQRIINTFGNYATAQLRRLQNALARDSYPQEEKEKHILNTINNQMDHFSRNYTNFSEGSIKLYLGKSDKEAFESEIFMDINLEKYPLRDFTKIYSEITNIVRDYEKLNHRNNKKDEGKLYKHAMHLVRLLMMGTEILNEHKTNTYREKEHDLLMDIRNGKYSYKELFDIVEVNEVAFREAAEKTLLPVEPDEKEVQKLLMDFYEEYYRK